MLFVGISFDKWRSHSIHPTQRNDEREKTPLSVYFEIRTKKKKTYIISTFGQQPSSEFIPIEYKVRDNDAF